MDTRPEELWFKLLDAKYLKGKSFYGSPYNGTSQFWKGLHKVKHLYKWGAEHIVHTGDRVRFWHDTWLGSVPLKIQYKSIFEIARTPDAMVKELWKEDGWDISLRRSLQGGCYRSGMR